jgi:hypothetical protein
MVYVTYDGESGEEKVSGYGCSQEGKCGNPMFDPCPLYIELFEKRGIRKSS